jgi:hypothetical protein
MSGKTSLTVNEVTIKLNYFVEAYVLHVTSGIVASLNNTGPIKTLDLTINKTGEVKIDLNGTAVPLKPFPVEIIRNTLAGMTANMKGVKGELKTLEIKIEAE